MAREYIEREDLLNTGREKLNRSIDKSYDAEETSKKALKKAGELGNEAITISLQSNSNSKEAKSLANDTKERLEDILADGDSNAEVVSARKPIKSPAFKTLGERLDYTDYLTQNEINKKGDKFKANSKGFLKIPVYNNSKDYQATHPSILHFPNGFNGYKFWMAFTPYEKENEAIENPSIVVSNDCLSWEVPKGLVNPLVKTDNVKNMHYSDPHLVFVNNKLECWYRKKFRGEIPIQEQIVRKISFDGINWEDEEILYARNTGADLLCPVVIYENSKYCIWVSNFFKNKLEYFESQKGSDWIKIRDISFPKHPDNLKPWHFDVKKNGILYELYYSAGLDYNAKTIAYATSQDNMTYTFKDDVLECMPQNFDEKRVYRPCIVDLYGKRFLYYGGTNGNNDWYIGLSVGQSSNPTFFEGIEFSNTLPFFGQGRIGHTFPNGIITPDIFTEILRIGMYSTLKQDELKLVVPNESEIKIILNNSLKNVGHVKSGDSYSGLAMSALTLQDLVTKSLAYNIRVSKGRLQYFDGSYYQGISLNVTGSSMDRPKNPEVGLQYFDRTLGKPIWFGGTDWVDANGNIT